MNDLVHKYFTARTQEELALVTVEAKAAEKKHNKYSTTLEGRCFTAVGVNSPYRVETFLYVRLVQNVTGSKWYCMIWLYADDEEVTIVSHAIHEDSYEAQCLAFNKLLNTGGQLHHTIGGYVEALAALYRPDLKGYRIV